MADATCVNLTLLSFLLYRLRTSWLHQHFFFYTLVVIINCWLLSLVLRCYLSKEGTWKSLSGDVKPLSCGLLNVLIRPVSSEHHWEHVPSDNQSRFPKLWLKGWRKRGEGRWGEQRKWLWGGQGHHRNNALLCFISLMELPHFRLYRKTLTFPFPLVYRRWTLLFALHPCAS